MLADCGPLHSTAQTLMSCVKSVESKPLRKAGNHDWMCKLPHTFSDLLVWGTVCRVGVQHVQYSSTSVAGVSGIWHGLNCSNWSRPCVLQAEERAEREAARQAEKDARSREREEAKKLARYPIDDWEVGLTP